jgi:hypothetical protein
MSLVYSTIAAIPGLVIAFFTQNVSVLVAYTGGYAGLGIMLVIPPILVYYSRK